MKLTRIGGGARGFLGMTFVMLMGMAPGYAQMDDFNDGNDTGWSRYNPIGVASFSLVDGGYRIQTAPSPDPASFGPGRAGSLLTGAGSGDYFYLSVDLVNWDDSVRQAVGLLARIQTPGPGTTTGYAFTWDRGGSATSGDIDMSRIDGENPSGIAPNTGDAIHLVPGRSYRMVFLGKGTTMEGRMYELPNTTTPVVTIIGTDANYTTGAVGLVTFANAATARTDATFDNFVASDVEPPTLTVQPVFTDLYVLSWPAAPVEFMLQTASKLPASEQDWKDITDTLRVGDLDTFALETGVNATITPPAFFRLKRK